MKLLVFAACVCMAAAGPQRTSDPFSEAADATGRAAHSAAHVVASPFSLAARNVRSAYGGIRKVRSASDPFSEAADATGQAAYSAAHVVASPFSAVARRVRSAYDPFSEAADATGQAGYAAAKVVASPFSAVARRVRSAYDPFSQAADATGQAGYAAAKVVASPFSAVARRVRSAYDPFSQAADATGQAGYAAAKVVASPFSAVARRVSRAAPSDATAQVVQYVSDVKPDGFGYKYETDNGISANSAGQLRQVGDQSALVVQGTYRWNSPDGIPVQVNYVADENGYQPQGDVLPVGPEVPIAIQRSLEYIHAHPYTEEAAYGKN